MKKKFMNKKLIKYLIIVGIILIIIIVGVVLFIKDFNKDRKETLKVMEKIKTNYKSFSPLIDQFLEKRTNFYNLKEQLMLLEDVETKKMELLNTMTEYENLIIQIDNENKFLKKNCQIKYFDNSVNNTCDLFKQEYEAAMNYYITDINVYNNFVKEYNNWIDENNNGLEKLEKKELTLYKDYIDYDKDGSYLGGNKNEETKA